MGTRRQGAAQGKGRLPDAGKFARRSAGKVLTKNAGIFKVAGIGESQKPGGYSACKHELDR